MVRSLTAASSLPGMTWLTVGELAYTFCVLVLCTRQYEQTTPCPRYMVFVCAVGLYLPFHLNSRLCSLGQH